ncbi:BCCT family transporter [Sphingobacterium sp. SGR-19]|uniref:BCCT family transporter n=1 Tax=Sphingobacterium sp. SGR-19 TaxID=2710886 RepID=UPI0013ED3CC3|nr:BCCT family transporter [Sphingobacterium sp. SGR-19]NGM63868.1 BCCT family transporter [Sphingobacterium sp. SGR-19]
MRKKNKTTFLPGIVIPSLVFIFGVTILSVFFPNRTEYYLSIVKNILFENLNWLYVMVVTIFVFFLLFLFFSKYGGIKLGTNDSKPEFSFFSWVSMLFAAGMGIGLMYFGVAEPISHYADAAFGDASPIQRAKSAQLYTFFHWGIHAWSIYGLVGLSLAYFTYRYRLPLSLRSCFYPILKEKIDGKAGDLIDMFALCSTFFGITTSLGFGVSQLGAGLVHLGVLDEISFTSQILIVVGVMTISILSATTGVAKGVKLLSQINIVAVVVLLIFILIFGPTVYLLGSFSENLGYYINEFFNLTFATHTYEPAHKEWFFNWTILYWAWWISWSPYVGLFIAKISKGRTIREFIGAVLIIPTLFNFLWMTVFGNSATWLDQHTAQGALAAVANNTDILLFEFFKYFPLTAIVSVFAILILVIFFVTSADSGIFVMNNISTKNAAVSPKWQMVFWGGMLALLALVLLNAGGLKSLQTMTLITALPFAIIMLFFCYSLVRGLFIDNEYYMRPLSHSTNSWSGTYWRERLESIISYHGKNDINQFLSKTVKVAFEQLAEAFKSNDIIAEVKSSLTESPHHVEIKIQHENMADFIYGVQNVEKTVSDYFRTEENAPDIEHQRTYIPMTYFGDSRKGYDVQYFTKEEIISDVLKQYERFLSLSSDEKNEIFLGQNIREDD